MTDEAIAEKVTRRMEGKKRYTFKASELVYYEFDCEAENEDEAWDMYNSVILTDYIVYSHSFQTDEVICHDEEEEDE